MAVYKHKEFLAAYLERYTDMKTYTLAKLIFDEHSHLFKNIQQVRNILNYYRGSKGKAVRKLATHPRELNYDTNTTLNDMLKGMESKAEGLKVFDIPKRCKKMLYLTDIHIPYQHDKSLLAALKYGLECEVDSIFLGGDILDMYSVSSHEKNPDKPSIREEFEMARMFFAKLRELFPFVSIYYLEGNHEKRWKRYLASKASELFGSPEFDLPIILRLGEFNIQWIPNGTLVRHGNLNIIHGNEFKGGGGINVARSLYLRSKANMIAGDKHKTNNNIENTINGDTIRTYSVGCLCDLNPEYIPFGHTIWNHGFAIIERSENDFIVHNKRIENGVVV